MNNDLRHLEQRREFLKFMGRTATICGALPWWAQIGCSSVTQSATTPPPFLPLAHSRKDELTLAQGLAHQILIKWNDPINSTEFFGVHNDFLAFEPLNKNQDEGILLVNHEYFHPVLFHNRVLSGPRKPEDVHKEQLAIGNSLLHIKKVNGTWQVVQNSHYNRRISSRTMIPFQKGYKVMGKTQAMGTLANCAGGKTPWGTFLTCEENYDIFYGEVTYINKQRQYTPHDKYRWQDIYPENHPEHYGWVVEIEPRTGKAIKRNALGRFEHEGALVRLSASGFPVVYMGEDRKGGFIYKFVSQKKNSLEKGTLYVANTLEGRWIPLDIDKNPELQKHFNNQQEVLIYAHRASQVAGGTPQDRPEDIEMDPVSGDIFVALTNNADRNNYYGSLLKISEKNNNLESLEFTSQTWLAGSQKNGFACPDNLVFDRQGNLWMTTDMSEKDQMDGRYPNMGNNGLYYIPLRGDHAGKAFLVATAPTDAEFTGPMFSPDYKTLFLCVQHPGAMTEDPKKPTSCWPEGPGHGPKSSVVMIQGPLLDRLQTV